VYGLPAVEIADVERLLTMPEGAVKALHDALGAAGLDERFVARLARVGERLDDPLRAPMRTWHARRLPEPAAVAARLFLLHDTVSLGEASRLLGDLTPLAAVDVVRVQGDAVTSRAHLALAGGLFVFGDRFATADAVPPLNAVTAVLARAAIPNRGVEAALDLGCGAGALAVALVRVARRVVATDISPRALAWARFNARLNGVVGVDLRVGDLFEPVRREHFDLVVSQPPFVSRRADADASAFVHGGERGDELALRALAGAPSRLSPNGRAVIVADWPLLDGDPLDVRVRAAIGDTGADALVLQSPAKNLDEYCTSLAAAEHPRLDDSFARAACAQRDHFDRLGVRGISQALVVLEASGDGRTALVPVRHGHDAPVTSEIVDRIVAAHALASGAERALLAARLRMPSETRLVEQPSAHGAGAAVIVQLPAARPEWPFALEPLAATALREIGEAPSVLEAARMAARREGGSVDAAAARIVAVARDALRRGALEVATFVAQGSPRDGSAASPV
jgi:SAM-dependent methyltransferase